MAFFLVSGLGSGLSGGNFMPKPGLFVKLFPDKSGRVSLRGAWQEARDETNQKIPEGAGERKRDSFHRGG
jgi:hypothetical protein